MNHGRQHVLRTSTELRSLCESAGATVGGTLGAMGRLQALVCRHPLDAPIMRPLTAWRAWITPWRHGVFVDIQGLLTRLRAFDGVDPTAAREDVFEPSTELLLPLATEDDDIETTESRCLRLLSSPATARATDIQSYADSSLSAISDALRQLSLLAWPSTDSTR
jgi:hypothetical protein